MARSADDPEELNPKADEFDTKAIEDAAFDTDLIGHMAKCWDAMCENAERLTKKVNLLVSVLVLLFGLGLFKLEWTVDPKHISRIDPGWCAYAVKGLLSLALLLFGRGLYLAMRGVSRGGPRPPASDLLQFPKEIIKCPPLSDRETRAQVFYRFAKAITELSTQNAEKAARVTACEKWFIWGLSVVFVALLLYTWTSVPPMH